MKFLSIIVLAAGFLFAQEKTDSLKNGQPSENSIAPKDSTTAVISEKKENKTIKDSNGKIFYLKKDEPQYSLFKRINGNRVPLYSEESAASEVVLLFDPNEFVEIVDGNYGLVLTKVRVFNKEKGYLEGYTKNAFFSKIDYYSEAYTLTPEEIARLKEIALKAKREAEEQERIRIERERTELFNKIVALSRKGAKPILGMSYEVISKYMKDYYKEDAAYGANASKTIKFVTKDKKDSSVVDASFYFTLDNGKVVGALVKSSVNGLSKEEAFRALFEMTGEIYYKVDEVKVINDDIKKEVGKLENSLIPVVIKVDSSKPNTYDEIMINEFSGIE